MATVKVPGKYTSTGASYLDVPSGFGLVPVPDTTVEIADDGQVTWEGEAIGYVWKGHRMYSPPTHRGSRIVRYHKKVPEWRAGLTNGSPMRYVTADSRRGVFQMLIASAIARRQIADS